MSRTYKVSNNGVPLACNTDIGRTEVETVVKSKKKAKPKRRNSPSIRKSLAHLLYDYRNLLKDWEE